MIDVLYVSDEATFGWCPETVTDNEAIINFVLKNDLNTTFRYSAGTWYFPESRIDDINNLCLPLRDLFRRTKSFSSWLDNRKKHDKDAGIEPAIILIYPIFSFLSHGTQPLPLEEIDSITKFFSQTALNDPRFKSKKWDGIIHLYKKRSGQFPTGFLQAVVTELQKAGILYRLEYLYEPRVAPKFAFQICDGLTPDPDQEEAVEAAWRGGRGVVKAPTGFGKTAILAKRLIVKFGVPTLFVANKKSLLDDAAQEFSTGIIDQNGKHPKVSQIKDGMFCSQKPSDPEIFPIESPIIVATIQSLSARLSDPRTRDVLLHWLRHECKFVMVDECQAVGTKIWDEILHECLAPYRILLSATPRRTDGATIKLIGDSGPILFTTSAEKQIEQGRLCELDINYNVFDHKVFNEDDANVEYADCYKTFIVENDRRNREMIIDPALEMIDEGRHVLVLIQQIEHGHILKRMFQEAGLEENDVRFVWGDTSDKVRHAAIKEFRKGDFKVMIGSTIFDAGVNIPIISGVVLGGAGNSDITLIQRIGRGARNFDYEANLGYIPDFVTKSGGKKVTKIVDVIDKNIKFFHKQSIARYRNASEEFGASRVKISSGNKGDLKRTSKRVREYLAMIEQMDAQYGVMNEFSRK